MIDDSDIDAMLAAYADGELDAARTAEVEAHIAAHPAAARIVATHRETSALLRAAFTESQFRPSAAVPARPRGRPRVPAAAWALAASVVLALAGYAAGVTWPYRAAPPADPLMLAVAEDHAIYSRETVHLVEVPAAQAEHLKAWLGKRVNATLVIPDFAPEGLTFAGGRLVVLDGQPVAELVYTRESGMPIAFYVMARPGEAGAAVQQRLGATCVARWDDGQHAYFLAGDADSAPLIRRLTAVAKAQL